jgi:hypothetical protein
VLTCVNNVLNVLTPWPKFIELAPKDKAVLILLNGIGIRFDNELSADIEVLNEDEPSELKRVIVDALKYIPLLERYKPSTLPPIAKLIELVIKELVVKRPVLTVLANVDTPTSSREFRNREVPTNVLTFNNAPILRLNELIDIVLREVD